MTAPAADNTAAAPIACTLTAPELRSRCDWIDKLSARSISRAATPDGLIARFRAEGDIEQRLRALAAAEAACCPFLDFEIVVTGEVLELRIHGPADARPVIDDMFRGALDD